MGNDPFAKLFLSMANRRDLNWTDKGILAIITNRMGVNGECWPGVRRLAEDAGVDKATVCRTLKHLVSGGHLLIKNKGSGTRNYYTLPPEKRTQSADTSKDAECTQSTDAVYAERVQKRTQGADTKRKRKEPVKEQELFVDDTGKKPRSKQRKKNIEIDYPEDYIEFYSAYPKKVSKAEGLKAWQEFEPDAELRRKILRTLQWQREEWKDTERKYIPAPGPWLRGRRWEDEPSLGPTILDGAPPVDTAEAFDLILGTHAQKERAHE